MNNVVNIFATDIEKEARALAEFSVEGDLNVELLKLNSDLNQNSTRPFSEYEEIIVEQLKIVKRALELLRLRK